MSSPVKTGSAKPSFGLGSKAAETAQAGLRLVAPVKSRASRTPFVVIVMLVLAAGLAGLILLSTVLQQQAFELSRLQQQSSSLTTQYDALLSTVEKEQSPGAIADAAMKLGMVPSPTPVFLDMTQGKILGSPTQAKPGTNIGGG